MTRPVMVGAAAVALLFAGTGARAAFGGGASAEASLSAATLEPASKLAAAPGCRALLTAEAMVSWDATPSSWASGYRLERLRGSSVELDTTVTPSSATSYLDGPLSLSTTYTWRLTAFTAGWTSPTVSVSATTPLLC